MVDKITSLAGYDDFVNSLQEEMNKGCYWWVKSCFG